MVDECNTLSDEELLERGDQAGQSQEARAKLRANGTRWCRFSARRMLYLHHLNVPPVCVRSEPPSPEGRPRGLCEAHAAHLRALVRVPLPVNVAEELGGPAAFGARLERHRPNGYARHRRPVHAAVKAAVRRARKRRRGTRFPFRAPAVRGRAVHFVAHACRSFGVW
eukprot:1545355-Rhodomonas_salina.6